MKLPKEWEFRKLGTVVSKQKYAMVDGPFGSNLKSEHYKTSGIPVLQSGFVTSGKFFAKSYVYVDKELFDQQRRSAAKGGDLLMAKIGAQAGKCAIIPLDHPESIIAGNCLKLSFDEEQNSTEFFNMVLAYNYDKNGLCEIKTETAQPAISLKSLKDYKVPVPPLSEQKKIAKILSTWDQAISATEKLLENSQQQKKALMQELLTGKKRLLDENGVKFIKPWDICELKDIAQIIMGSSPKSEFYNDLGHGLPLIQGNADIKNRYSNPRIYTSEITKECINEDVLLSVRAPVGTVARSKHHACIGRGIAAIRAKLNVSQSFLYHLMIWKEPKWANFSQGSTFESINSDDIKSLKLLVPTLEEQKKIGRVLYLADQEIETLQKKLDCLKQEKKALMQQLLTGKKRVKVAA